MTAIILSGGDNKRIQREKSFISISQKSIIEREIEVLSAVFSRIIIVTNRKKSYKHLKRNGWGRRGFLKEKGVKVDIVSDIFPGKGPLVGIYSGLMASDTQHNFVVSCDLPFLNEDLIVYMKKNLSDEHDVVVPRIDGFLEPLHASYSKSCLVPIKEHLLRDDLRVQSFFSEVKLKYIEKDEIERFDPDLIAFFNVNTEEELKKARIIAQGRS